MTGGETDSRPTISVSAVVLSHNRVESVRQVLELLGELAVDDVIVADNGSADGTTELVANWGGRVSLLSMGENIGVAARNRAAAKARNELILMLDDDSYPFPGALDVLIAAFARDPALGIAGGRVVDLDERGAVVADGTEPGSFDWFLSPRGVDPVRGDGYPASFFSAGRLRGPPTSVP